jgi:hypothetical protein
MHVHDSSSDERPDPHADLVPVFETTEAGLLPLARAALEAAGIEYAVQNRGFVDQILGRRSSMTVGETDTPLQVVVRAEDEARAREMLADLSGTDAQPASLPTVAANLQRRTVVEHRDAAAGDVDLTDAESGASLGQLTPSQFDSLAAHLELESKRDDDYYIDEATVAMLEEKGVAVAAVALLRQALAGRSEVTVRFRR